MPRRMSMVRRKRAPVRKHPKPTPEQRIWLGEENRKRQPVMKGREWFAVHTRAIAERTHMMPREVKRASNIEIPLPKGYTLKRVSAYSSLTGGRFQYVLYKNGRKVAHFGNMANAAAYAERKANLKKAYKLGKEAGILPSERQILSSIRKRTKK